MDVRRERRDAVRRMLRRWGQCDATAAAALGRLRAARARIDELYEIARPAPDGQPRGGSPGDPVWRALERVMRMRERFDLDARDCEAEIERERAFDARVRAAVGRLRPQERRVIERRYLRGQTAKQTAAGVGCSRAGEYLIERNALDRIWEIDEELVREWAKTF